MEIFEQDKDIKQQEKQLCTNKFLIFNSFFTDQ